MEIIDIPPVTDPVSCVDEASAGYTGDPHREPEELIPSVTRR